MPNNISITDSAAVAHTFTPVGGDRYKNRNGVNSLGDETLTLTYSESTKNRRTNRVALALDLPLERVVAGVNVADDIARFTGSFIMPVSMTTAEREELRSIVYGALNNVIVKAAVKDLQPDVL